MIGFLRRRRHTRLRELLSAYIDGEVSDSESREVEEHLSGCEECRLELDSLRATVGLLRGLPQLDAPRSFTLAEAPPPVSRTPPVVWTARLATSVAALLLVALVLGDAFGIVTQTGMAQEPVATSRAGPPAAQIAPEAEVASPATAPVAGPPGQPGLPGSPAPSEALPESSAPAQPAARAAPTTPADDAAPPATATPTPAPPAPPPAAAMAPDALPSDTPGPEMMAAAALEATPVEGDTRALASGSETQEAVMTTEPEEGKAAATPETAEAPTGEEEVAMTDSGIADAATPEEEAVPQTPAIALGPEPIEEEGITLPLRQLEIAFGSLFVALTLATLWVTRRRSGLSR